MELKRPSTYYQGQKIFLAKNVLQGLVILGVHCTQVNCEAMP